MPGNVSFANKISLLELESPEYRSSISTFSDLIKAHNYVFIVNADTISYCIAELVLAKLIPCLSVSPLIHKIDIPKDNEYALSVGHNLIHASLLMKTVRKVLVYLPISRRHAMESIIKDINTDSFSIITCLHENEYATCRSVDVRGHNIELAFPCSPQAPVILLLKAGAGIVKVTNSNLRFNMYYSGEPRVSKVNRYIRNKDLYKFKLDIPLAHTLLSRAAEIRDILINLKSPVDEITAEADKVGEYLYKTYNHEYPF